MIKRVSVLATFLLLVSTVVLSVQTEPTAASDDGAMFRGNAAHTGVMPGPGPDSTAGIGATWSFATGNAVTSSPAVVDGVVYVGSYDGKVYALDAGSGAERWAFATGGFVSSSPAVVDGVVYVGSGDGKVYALGSLTPAMSATEAAVATSQANGIATTVAQVATGVAAQATVAALHAFSDALAETAVTGANLPAGFANPRVVAIDAGLVWLPPGEVAFSSLQVSIPAAPDASAHVVFAVYGSKEAARAAFAAAPAGLARAGWQEREAQGVGHDATCLVQAGASQSQAVCFVSRDDVVIATYSTLPFDAAEAVFGNANDLGVWASEVYDQTARPD